MCVEGLFAVINTPGGPAIRARAGRIDFKKAMSSLDSSVTLSMKLMNAFAGADP